MVDIEPNKENPRKVLGEKGMGIMNEMKVFNNINPSKLSDRNIILVSDRMLHMIRDFNKITEVLGLEGVDMSDEDIKRLDRLVQMEDADALREFWKD